MKKTNILITLTGLLIMTLSTQTPAQQEEFIKKAVNVKPHPRQVQWQECEFTAFIHIGVNTFTAREWGTGKEDPSLFNPTQLDASQWVKTMKQAGMKLVVLTAKHHDGFCLWPSRYTEHSVKNSPWKGGKGNVVKDIAIACQQQGMKLGIYLSPADLYQIESPNGYYGNGSQTKKSRIPTKDHIQKGLTFECMADDYNRYFMNQLYELLTEYGPVYEVWFDGANPKDVGQKYNHQDWYRLIRKLQPEAVIFGKGPDCRWAGNERGYAREMEWSVVPISHPADSDQNTWPDMTGQDLGSRDKIRNAQYLHWYPAEADTSIRHGWFWRDSNQQVKSVEELLDIYYGSVGRNANLILNIPPDRRGLFDDKDTKALLKMGSILQKTFSQNLASGSNVKASHTRSGGKFSASGTVDGKKETYWSTDDWQSSATLEYDLGSPKTFNVVMVQECISEAGQRIEAFNIEAFVNGNWQQIVRATTVGYKRLLRINNTTAQKVRLNITESRMCPTVSEFGLFMAPITLSDPIITRDRQGTVSISCNPAGPKILYSVDGSPAKEFTSPFPLPKGGLVKAVAMGASQNEKSDETSVLYDVCKAKWKIHKVDSENPSSGEGADKAIDDDPKTLWHSQWQGGQPPLPHDIQIDLGETLTLKGFTYTPRQGPITGTINEYAFYVSSDGNNWGEPKSKGIFGNIKNNPVEQRVMFDKPAAGRYIRLVALSEFEGKPFTSAAEIGVITK